MHPQEPTSPTIVDLLARLSEYLTPYELKKVKEAYRFSDERHYGQLRRSGEPYISHPIAVAMTCAQWKLDKQAIMAALLHDVIEDQHVKKEELTAHFGAPVAALVDGLSKLDKIEFQTHIDAQAENFRKMLLAMARDVRVILIKLADRLHNMSTLGCMSTEKRHRIAKETMEVYVPIAHRLGLNAVYHELQELAFAHVYPRRYEVLTRAVKAARGNRREVVGKILESVQTTLTASAIHASIDGREKNLYGIYTKMRQKHLSFSQVLDVYGFRVVVETLPECYIALGALHGLYNPMPGKFKDYIAIPKANGYQSLHTTLIGPYGTPVEFQIRTQAMHRVAEAGVAAHWLYKEEGHNVNDDLSKLQQRTHTWLQSLLDIQQKTGDSAEFLEHVKIDLFPESVYVFTPKSKIVALQRGATVLDFAYNIHTDVGDRTIAAKINHEPATLRSELHNGDIVEITTSPHAYPTPHWLTFVRTGRARSAIRHYLRSMNAQESIQLGEHLLSQALAALNLNPALVSVVMKRLLNEYNVTSLDDLYIDIGTGKRMAALVARHSMRLLENNHHRLPAQLLDSESSLRPLKPQPVVIYGSEGISVQLGPCCQPIPGDPIVGQIKREQGLVVHSELCSITKHLRHKEPDRWIAVVWGKPVNRRFDCSIKVLMHNDKGVLARAAAAIGDADANIVAVNMDDNDHAPMTQLSFTVQIEDRIHLAKLIRSLRHTPGVTRIVRWRSGG